LLLLTLLASVFVRLLNKVFSLKLIILKMKSKGESFSKNVLITKLRFFTWYLGYDRKKLCRLCSSKILFRM